MPSFSNRNDYKSRRSTPNNSQHMLGIFSNEIRVLHWPRRVYWAIVLVKRGLQFRENLTKKIQMEFLIRTRGLCPTIAETWPQSHNVVLFTMNICASYDSPCIRSKSSPVFPGSSIWLLAAQKLGSMQYSKHLRNFPKFSLSSLCLSYWMVARREKNPNKLGMKLFKTFLVSSFLAISNLRQFF